MGNLAHTKVVGHSSLKRDEMVRTTTASSLTMRTLRTMQVQRKDDTAYSILLGQHKKMNVVLDGQLGRWSNGPVRR